MTDEKWLEEILDWLEGETSRSEKLGRSVGLIGYQGIWMFTKHARTLLAHIESLKEERDTLQTKLDIAGKSYLALFDELASAERVITAASELFDALKTVGTEDEQYIDAERSLAIRRKKSKQYEYLSKRFEDEKSRHRQEHPESHESEGEDE